MKCEKRSSITSCPFHPQLPGVWGYKKKNHTCTHTKIHAQKNPHTHMQEKGTQNTHTLSQSHGADPGETRLISLFTPNLTRVILFWWGDLHCALLLYVKVIELNKPLIIWRGTGPVGSGVYSKMWLISIVGGVNWSYYQLLVQHMNGLHFQSM